MFGLSRDSQCQDSERHQRDAVEEHEALLRSHVRCLVIYQFVYVTCQALNLTLAIRFNYGSSDDIEHYKMMKIVLGIVDFSLLALDCTMTVVCSIFIYRDIQEKKELKLRQKNHQSQESSASKLQPASHQMN